ncbi:hypothetical protein B0H10DRAFT_2245671 [Mycena sp. CBHHK59/15]|nr:hypothetical protein B0H10DRAFT_2245671 [Mycena sp. CBHHK59/15]
MPGQLRERWLVFLLFDAPGSRGTVRPLSLPYASAPRPVYAAPAAALRSRTGARHILLTSLMRPTHHTSLRDTRRPTVLTACIRMLPYVRTPLRFTFPRPCYTSTILPLAYTHRPAPPLPYTLSYTSYHPAPILAAMSRNQHVINYLQ